MSALQVWAKDYIGVPFVDGGCSHEGADCWGLLKLVLSEQFGVEVEDYEEPPIYGKALSVVKHIKAFGQMHIESGQWVKVGLHNVKPGDGILLRINNLPTHVGIAIGSQFMLHTEKGIYACREKYTGLLWKPKVLGAYRHASLVG